MDILIIGSGIAGLLVAENLLHYNAKVRIIDSADSRRGSGSPSAIMHAFPGRSLQPHPLLKQAYRCSYDTLSVWKQKYPDWVENKIRRPMNGKVANA